MILALDFSTRLATLPVQTPTGWKMELFAHSVIPSAAFALTQQQIVRFAHCQERISATSTILLAIPLVPMQHFPLQPPTSALTATPSAWSALGPWIASAVSAPHQVPIRHSFLAVPLV